MLATLAIAAVGVGVFVYYKAYNYVHQYRNVFKEIGLQELPQKGWTGGWTLFMEQKEDLFQLELDLIKKYGKVFGYFEGRLPTIMMADPNMLKQVMIGDHEHFVDRRILFPSRKRPNELGLTTLTGRRWKHVRQQITPAFTPANLRKMDPLLKKVANQFIENIGKASDQNKSFDAKEFSGFYTLDVIASVAFALEIDSFNNPDNPFVDKAKKVFTTVPLGGKFIASFRKLCNKKNLVNFLIKFRNL